MVELNAAKDRFLSLEQLQELFMSYWDLYTHFDFKGLQPYRKESLPPAVQQFCESTGTYLGVVNKNAVLVNSILYRDETTAHFLQDTFNLHFPSLMHFFQYRLLSVVFPHCEVMSARDIPSSLDEIRICQRQWSDTRLIFMPSCQEERKLAVWRIVPKK